jgi:hypothetical protein
MDQKKTDAGADTAAPATAEAPETSPLFESKMDDAFVAKRNALIDAWVVEHFHGSIVSRDTQIFNHVRAAVEDLKRRLTKQES